MIPSTDNSIMEDPVGVQLDDEIASLQAQISSLKSQRTLHASTILSSRSSKAILDRLRSSQKLSRDGPSSSSELSPLISTSVAQRAHKEENLYRLCAGITTFRVQDPDPNAVDNGNVLGIRFDASNAGKYIRPYYIMLNKPWKGSELLRVHRHTLPPCIPLATLLERHMPHGKGAIAITEKGKGSKKQDLTRFVRAVRREIVSYHNRVDIIKGLRKEFKLDEEVSKKGKGREKVITNISAADAEAKQVRIEWVDGRIGRAVVGEKGEVVQCVIIGEDGRDRENERRVWSGNMDGIGERLREGIY